MSRDMSTVPLVDFDNLYNLTAQQFSRYNKLDMSGGGKVSSESAMSEYCRLHGVTSLKPGTLLPSAIVKACNGQKIEETDWSLYTKI